MSGTFSESSVMPQAVADTGFAGCPSSVLTCGRRTSVTQYLVEPAAEGHGTSCPT